MSFIQDKKTKIKPKTERWLACASCNQNMLLSLISLSWSSFMQVVCNQCGHIEIELSSLLTHRYFSWSIMGKSLIYNPTSSKINVLCHRSFHVCCWHTSPMTLKVANALSFWVIGFIYGHNCEISWCKWCYITSTYVI